MKAPKAAPRVVTDTTASFSVLLVATLGKERSMNWKAGRRSVRGKTRHARHLGTVHSALSVRLGGGRAGRRAGARAQVCASWDTHGQGYGNVAAVVAKEETSQAGAQDQCVYLRGGSVSDGPRAKGVVSLLHSPTAIQRHHAPLATGLLAAWPRRWCVSERRRRGGCRSSRAQAASAPAPPQRRRLSAACSPTPRRQGPGPWWDFRRAPLGCASRCVHQGRGVGKTGHSGGRRMF